MSALEKKMWYLGEQTIIVKLTSCFDAILTLLSGNKRAQKAQGKRPIYVAFRKMTERKTDLYLIHSLPQVGAHTPAPPPPSPRRPSSFSFSHFPYYNFFYIIGILLP